MSRLVIRFLRSAGYECTSTNDPLSALEMLQEDNFNLVISDITMPGMNGLELVRKIGESHTGIDTILMTGNTKDYTYNDIVAVEASDFIGKPFVLAELKAKIERIRRERKTLSELQKATAALQLTLNRNRAITESVRDAIVMVDPGGVISYWNPAAERILGYAKEETTGRNLHGFIVPQRYQAAYETAWPKFVESGEGEAIGKTLEFEACRKDGGEIPVELSLSSFYMDGWHAVGLLRDITERKQAEKKLGEINRELEMQTRVAKEMASQAQMASQAKSEFLANMSHEIRTPLNGIIGMTGLLLDTELNEKQRRYTEMLRASGETLLGLINNILDFSKIEARKLDLEVADFDLSALLADFSDFMAVAAHKKGLALLCTLDPRIPPLLRGDPGRLGQILTNLVGNGIKFTPSGKVEILVSLISETAETAILRFVVRDTGIGIPEEKRSLLFEKFSQVDASTTREYGGTGLGLSIVKQLVELMGGKIGVKSECGCGTQFYFTIPLGKQTGSARRETVSPVLPPDRLAGLFADRKVHVLLAEDNFTNQQVSLGMLEKLGIKADTVANGVEALEALEATPYDIVLMDVQMPVMDGLEATRRIRDLQSDVRSVPIIALTARAVQGDCGECLKAGMNDYVTKPVALPKLAGVLQKWLSKGRRTHRGREDKGRDGNGTGELPVWAREGMLKRLMGDAELEKKVLDAFLLDLPGQIRTLKQYIESGDCRGAELQAHSIKSACANVGGEKLRVWAMEMERSLSTDDLGAAATMMAGLKTRFGALKKAIQASKGERKVNTDEDSDCRR